MAGSMVSKGNNKWELRVSNKRVLFMRFNFKDCHF